MAFVPPLWGKFGNNLKDLLTKKYDYKNQLAVKNNVASDLAIESTVGLGDAQTFTGTVKATYKNKDFGQIESEIGTAPNKDKATLSTEVKATKIYDGLTVIVKGTDVPNVKVTGEYRQESVATSVQVEAAKDKTQVEGTLAVGFDGFTVGGQGRYCGNHGVADYNFGAEYSQNEYALTIKTEKKTDLLVGSYWHNIPSSRNKLKTQVGGQVNWNVDNGSKVFTVGTEHDIDEGTTVKGKIDTDGVLGAVVEHRLTNPAVKLNLSGNWQVKDKSTNPKQFGVALTFGDY
jgi:hypothetical protein